jgi:hypothetical protein
LQENVSVPMNETTHIEGYGTTYPRSQLSSRKWT